MSWRRQRRVGTPELPYPKIHTPVFIKTVVSFQKANPSVSAGQFEAEPFKEKLIRIPVEQKTR